MENLTPETYYRVTVAIPIRPYIDSFIQQLEARFLKIKIYSKVGQRIIFNILLTGTQNINLIFRLSVFIFWNLFKKL